MPFKKSTVSVIIILVGLATIVVMSGLNFLIPQDTRIDADENPEAEQARYGAGTDERGYENMEKIYLITKDNIKIVANLYGVNNPAGWVILVHMMPATKESWTELANDFQNAGYESIAFDLRGHGESDGGPEGYLNFSDSQHQKSILDLEAAADYLIKEWGATPDKISFVGASISANLSLQYISENQQFKTAVLLSPGLNYRGIKTEPLVKNLKAGQKVFFISSRDDGEDAEENQKLYQSVPAGIEKEIKIYEDAGHGTMILENKSELKNLILEFLRVK